MIVPRGDESIRPGDRIIVIGSPDAARAWSRDHRAGDGSASTTSSSSAPAGWASRSPASCSTQDIRVRLVEARASGRGRSPRSCPTRASSTRPAFDPEFLERERIGDAPRRGLRACTTTRRTSTRATLAKLHGVALTIALVHDPVSVEVFERAGVDVAINPRQVTAEEIVRFAHDPRISQIAMLEGDRFEILDITVRAETELVGQALQRSADDAAP